MEYSQKMQIVHLDLEYIKKEINIKLGWEIGREGVRILTKSGNNDTITIGIISYQLFTQECIR